MVGLHVTHQVCSKYHSLWYPEHLDSFCLRLLSQKHNLFLIRRGAVPNAHSSCTHVLPVQQFQTRFINEWALIAPYRDRNVKLF